MELIDLVIELWRKHDWAINSAQGEESQTMKDYFMSKAAGIKESIAAINVHFEKELKQIELDFHSERDLPAIGEIIEKNGKKYKVIDNAVRNISTAELI